MARRDVSLDDKYTATAGRVVMTGIQALVRLPLLQKARDRAAGLNTAGFISGYRGSPLGGFDQQLEHAAKFLQPEDIVFKPGLNEELAATAVWGSQQVGLRGDARFDGVFALWYGKAPGVDRSGDVFKHANAAGAARHGGVLVVAGDDHAAKSSTLAGQSEFALLDAEIPVLNPASVQEVLEYGIYGWALSRFSGLWVGLIALADTMDSTATVDLHPELPRLVIPDYAMPPEGLNIRARSTVLERERMLRDRRIPAALAFVRANPIDRIVADSPNARIGIVTAGKSYLDVCQALSDLGIDDPGKLGIRFYKLGMTAPIEPDGARAFARGLDQVLVVEEKRDLIEGQLRRILYDLPEGQRPRIVGKQDREGRPLLSDVGDLSTADIARAIARCLPPELSDDPMRMRLERLELNDRELATAQAPNVRGPYFCSGCPHNSSTKLPEGSRAAGGIGCHYLVTLMPERNTDSFSQMGGEGASWVGEAPFVATPHIFANLGDGTYFHSGLLAIRFAVGAKSNITYKLLYNDAVAMTGGQHVDGPLTVPQLTRQLVAENVGKIVVVTDEPAKYGADAGFAPGVEIEHRDRLDAVQRALREIPGVTALVYDQTCAAEKRRRRKRGAYPDPDRRVFINTAVCEGCGDCNMQSNCLSVEPVETEFGRKRHIDQSSCNKDYSCLQGFCPSFVTVHGAKPLRREAADPSARSLPMPNVPTLSTEPYNILIAGVGGSGITALNAILGMAAHLDGNGFCALDMTGMAQKGGPVLSHLRINDGSEPVNGARVGTAMANLILAADPVVAAVPEALRAGGRDRSVTVMNAFVTPTSEFVRNPDVRFDLDALRRQLQGATRALLEFDAHTAATRLLGDAIYVNMMLLGFAWQSGLVPVSSDSILEAIALNGAAVEANRRAFAWGRLAAHDPAALAAEAGIVTAPKPEAESLTELVSRRAAFLTKYQNAAYAERYRALVAKAETAETARTPHFGSLAKAVARSYFKLLAYKDEYEVARLYTDGDFRRALAREFGETGKLEFHLAPPLLSKPDPITGRPPKRKFGPWVMGLFRLLAAMKSLRGTRLDLFGYSEERRTERQLIGDYESLVAELLAGLTLDNHAAAVALASLPERIRGFGPVKMKAIQAAKAKEAELLARFRAPMRERAA